MDDCGCLEVYCSSQSAPNHGEVCALKWNPESKFSKMLLAGHLGGSLPGKEHKLPPLICAGGVFIYDISATTDNIFKVVQSFSLHHGTMWSADFCEESVALSQTKSVLMFSISTGKLVQKIRARNFVTAVEFLSPQLLLAGCADGSVFILDSRDSSSSCVVVGNRKGCQVVGLRLVKQSPWNVVCSTIGSQGICLIDTRHCCLPAVQYEGHINSHLRAQLVVEDNFVASCGSDNTVRVWDLWSGTQLTSLPSTLEPSIGLAISDLWATALFSFSNSLVYDGRPPQIDIWGHITDAQRATFLDSLVRTFDEGVWEASSTLNFFTTAMV